MGIFYSLKHHFLVFFFLPPFYFHAFAFSALSADPPILKESIISCVRKVDDWRCLVGDLNGRVFMLFVESEERMNVDKAEVSGLRLELLGEVGGEGVSVERGRREGGR